MLDDKKIQMLELYNNGLECYKVRKFTEGKDFFKKALEIYPEDGPSKLYFSRCENYEKNPPADDWDGVWVMTTK